MNDVVLQNWHVWKEILEETGREAPHCGQAKVVMNYNT